MSQYEVYENAERTILLRHWPNGAVDVATREDADDVWGPPVSLRRVGSVVEGGAGVIDHERRPRVDEDLRERIESADALAARIEVEGGEPALLLIGLALLAVARGVELLAREDRK